ncbi:MAG TPA: SPOR domain-containing protein [Chryseolinea sp.]
MGAIIKQQDFSQSLFFNQFITYDDGALFAHLTKIEMLTEEESQAAIYDFIKAIQEGIYQEGKFEIKELGVFCFVDNRLELLNEKDYARVLTRCNAPAASETPEELHSGDDNNETPPLSDQEKENEKLTAKAEDTNDEYDVFDQTLSSSSFPQHSWITHNRPEPLNEVPQGSTAFIGPTKKRRDSSRALKFIRVTIPLIVLGLILIRLSLRIPGGHQNVVPIDSAGPTPTDSISNHALNPVERSQSTPPSVFESFEAGKGHRDEESSRVYHVIIGAFRFESNADKLVAEQLTRGHAVSKLGKRNGYYLVSYESTTDVWTAKKICKNIKAIYPEVWLDKQE